MPGTKKARSEEREEKGRRKKSPRQHDGKLMKAPAEKTALHDPMVENPVALLTSPEMGHPANAPLRAQAMAHLQRQRGNTYVQRLLRSRAIQAKLTVNPPDDAYEREADRVAEQVMRVPEPQLRRQVEPEEEEEEVLRRKPLTGEAAPLAQRQVEPEEEEEEVLRTKPLTGQAAESAQRQIEPEEEEEEEEVLRTKPLTGEAAPLAQRQIEPEEEEEEEEALRTKPLTGEAPPLAQRQIEPEEEEEPIEMKRIPGGTPQVSPQLEGRIQAVRGGGQALDSKVRDQMESAFGADFSGVRVHADAEADSLAKDLGATAFTTGKDVFFRDGSYQPGSEAGQKLIGHELAHVVQQSGPPLASQLAAIESSQSREGEAEGTAQVVASGTALTGRLNNGAPAQATVRRKAPYGVIQGSLVDWVASKLTQVLTFGKYDPEQRKKGILMGKAMRALKQFQDALDRADKVLATAEAVADMNRALQAKDRLGKIRGKIGQLKRGPGAVIDTQEKLDALIEAQKAVNKLAETKYTWEQLQDPKNRDDFIDSCSGGLKLAAAPLKKLPSPMSDFAVFFTDADVIIKGMARGFVHGAPASKEARERMEREAGTRIFY